MDIYFLITGVGFVLFLFCLAGLVWMIRNGQLDDLDTPALRMLLDDRHPDHESSQHHPEPSRRES